MFDPAYLPSASHTFWHFERIVGPMVRGDQERVAGWLSDTMCFNETL